MTLPELDIVRHQPWLKRLVGMALLALIPVLVITVAYAVNPNAGTTTTGQTLHIEIESPADNASFKPENAFTVSGQTALGEFPDPMTNVFIVIDISGSTENNSTLNQDCGGTTEDDDINNDGQVGNTLDCQISGAIALVDSLSNAVIQVAVVAFGSSADTADVDPTIGDQTFTTPTADNNSNGTPDLEEVLRSLDALTSTGAPAEINIRKFTQISGLGTGTHFNNAITAVNNAAVAAETNVVFFLSDGSPNVGTFTTGDGSPLATAAAANIVFHTYSVGNQGTGCGAGAALRVIADTTGGTCTVVADPSTLQTVLPGTTPAGISQVNVAINGGDPVTVFPNALGDWSASIPGGVIDAGVNTVAATVIADDNTQVTANITVFGVPAGDSNGDGVVNITDLQDIQKARIGLIPLSDLDGVSEVNGDSKINSFDLSLTLACILGINITTPSLTAFPECPPPL